MNVVDQFIGTWRLIQWSAKPAAGDVIYPFGEHAVGQLVYDSHGYMMVEIMKQERKLFASNDLLQGTVEEIVAAYTSFVAYSGTYSIDVEAKKVVHHIHISSFPNWVGQDQERFYNIQDDFLTLQAPAVGTTQHEVSWRKIV